MSTNHRTILFVGIPAEQRESGPSSVEPWTAALLTPLGHSAAILHFARQFDAQGGATNLILPRFMAEQLPEGDAGARVYAYDRRLGDAGWGEGVGQSASILLIDASRLPHVQPHWMLAAHRNGGAAMTVFYDLSEEEYCSEQLALDPTGTVRGTIRQYTDSRRGSLQRCPLGVVLTRRMFRPDPDCWVTSFSELVEYLSDRVRRSGERVDWVRDAAVQGCASPLAALLSIVEKLPSPETADLDKHRNVEGESLFRLQGAVEIGRHVSIGPGAIIIGPAALGDGSNIGAHAVVSRSVVLPGECVPAHAHCHHRVIGRPENSAAEHLEREVPDHEMRHPSAAGPGRAHETLKRLSDAVLALLTLVTLSPLLLLIAVVIKSTSRGPVLFRHRRQGKGGTEFDCLKFRTMGAGADAQQHELRMANQVDGPQFKLLNDPRVTRVGRVLRRTNLDELPQFLNVLLGQMSLVGPRPSPDNENQCCPPWRKARLSVRPGITGLWQVTRSDDRHQTDFQEWIYYDTCYVERRCLWLDLQIIWQTVRILLRCGTSRRWRRRWMPGAADHEVVAPYVRPAFSRSSQ